MREKRRKDDVQLDTQIRLQGKNNLAWNVFWAECHLR